MATRRNLWRALAIVAVLAVLVGGTLVASLLFDGGDRPVTPPPGAFGAGTPGQADTGSGSEPHVLPPPPDATNGATATPSPLAVPPYVAGDPHYPRLAAEALDPPFVASPDAPHGDRRATGVVQDGRGLPVGRARLEARFPERQPLANTPPARVFWAEADGRFAIEDLPDDQATALLALKAFHFRSSTQVLAGDETDLRFVVRAWGVIAGVVRTPAGAPAREFSVLIRRAYPKPRRGTRGGAGDRSNYQAPAWPDRNPRRPPAWPPLDPFAPRGVEIARAAFAVTDGRFVFPVGLGQFDLRIVGPDGRWASREPLSVEAGHATPLSVTLGPATTLVGRITDRGNRQGIAQAVLTVHQVQTGAAVGRARTGPEGDYRIDLRAGGELQVLASALSYKSQGATVTVPAGRTVNLDLALDPGVVIEGTVTGAGQPIAGLTVSARPVEPAPAGALPLATATTDAGGNYRLVGLSEGAWQIVVGAGKGFLAHGQRLDVAGSTTRLDVTLEPAAALVVTLVPPPGADLKPNALPDTLRLRLAWDPTQGPFPSEEMRRGVGLSGSTSFAPDEIRERVATFLTLVPGRYTLEVTEPRWRTHTQAVRLAAAERQRLTVRLEVGARVEGVVTDTAGTPLPGARVYAYREQWREPGVRVVTVDAEGRFMVGGLEQARYTFTATLREFRDATQTLDVAGVGQTVTLKLDRGLTLSGLVSGPDGRPVQGAVIRLRAGARGLYEREPSPLSDAAGKFTIGGLLPGTFPLEVRASNLVPWSGSVSVPRRERFEVRLLAGITLGGRVVDAADAPVARAHVMLVPKAAGAGLTRQVWSTSTDTEGLFSLAGLEPGEYTLSIRASDRPDHRETMSLQRSETDRVFRLVPGFRFSGTVRAFGGAELPPCSVSMVEARSGGANGYAPVDPVNGGFAMAGLPAGEYRLIVRDQRTRVPLLVTTLTLSEDTTGYELEVRVGQRATVRGTVVDAAGKGMATVRLTLLGERTPKGPGPRLAILTDGQGRFALENVPEGRYAVTAHTRDGRTLEPTWTLVVRGGDVEREFRVTRVLAGPRVTAVRAGSEGARSGLQVGDVIVRYAGERVRSRLDLSLAIGRHQDDAGNLTIELERDGLTRALSVRPGQLGATFR